MSRNLYEVLGLSKDADRDAIRKSYMKLSKQHHPDRGGDPEKFKEMSQAYEVLSDDSRRSVYDLTGSIDGAGAAVGNPFEGMGMPDIFSMFGGMGGMFGGGGGRGPGPQQKRQKPAAKITEMPLTLFDFYYGKQVKLTFDRKKFCGECKGEGALSYKQCPDCGGNGFQERMMQMGPGFAAINRSPCSLCNAKGRMPAKICTGCSGKKFLTQEKTLHAKIDPGMRPGEVLVFANECSDDPGYMEPGDVNIILQEADEATSEWKRIGDDLYTEIGVTLLESLTGCEKKIKTHPGYPGGLPVTVDAGTRHTDTVVINQKGMPKKNAKGFGNLFVRITVSVNEKDRAALRAGRDALITCLGAPES